MTMQGNELKAIRKRLGATQDALAKALGLTPQFIGMMERDEKAIEHRTEWLMNYLAADLDRREGLQRAIDLFGSTMFSHEKRDGKIVDTTEASVAMLRNQIAAIDQRMLDLFGEPPSTSQGSPATP